MSKRQYSLKMKCSLVLAAAMAISILFYYVSNHTVTRILDTYFQVSVYIERATDRTADKLQKYITDKNLASNDIEGLNQWSRKHILVYYTIFMDDEMRYSSYYAGENGQADADIEDELDGESASDTGESSYKMEELYGNTVRKYEMEFADGTGQVYLLGLFEYQFYLIAHYIELALSALLFLLIFLVFLQKKLKYVRQLENEVKILEGGGMDKEITVKGMDELSALAAGLNEMRMSLEENMRAKEELLRANNSLVTGMAHDLRTPLTSLLLYTELLSKKKYKDENEMEEYLKKTALKANQIKSMSDQLFKQFYISRDDNIIMEPPHSLRSVLEERLSDLMVFLESQGFTVKCSISWPDVKISVVSEYMDRILDNIASNLQKYAEMSEPVEITVSLSSIPEKKETCMKLTITNKAKACCDGVESTNLGVLNIKGMMEKMYGRCIVKEMENLYEISMFLPVVK